MGRLFLFAVALFGIGIALSGRPQTPATPSLASATLPQPPVAAPVAHRPGEPMLVPGQSVELKRAGNGHFHAPVMVNGQPVTMVVDTGATVVALSIDDARTSGLAVDPSTFAVVGTGASGPVRGIAVTLDSITLGGRRVGPVAAVVLDGLDRSLLGQSFLGKLDEVRIAGDTMVLR